MSQNLDIPPLSAPKTAALVVVVLMVLASCGVGRHPIETIPPARGEPDRSDARELRVFAVVTGFVKAGPDILLAGADDTLEPQWVPSVAYLVEHPTGWVVLDTGVDPSPGGCAYGFRPFFWVPCRASPDHSVLNALKSLGVEPQSIRYVVVSHFHGDHVAGLRSIIAAADVPVVTTVDEWAAARSVGRIRAGILRRQVRGNYSVRLVEGPFVDLLGDGSIWIISTPGHTPGHLSALLNVKPKPILLTFDVAHLREGWETETIPGFVVNERNASRSLRRLRELAASHADVLIIFGHEPTQWSDKAGVTQIAP